MLARWESYRAEIQEMEQRMKTLAFSFLKLGDYESASRCTIKAEGMRFVQGRMPTPEASFAPEKPTMAAAPAGSEPGLFITFEGIDGAGKSSHIEALAMAFEERGRRVVRTREPGGTALAETLRTIVLSEPMDPLTEALLMFAARREHLACVIAPALAAGQVVICDRFTDSTFAYQGGGRGFSLKTLSALERIVQDAGMCALAGRSSLPTGGLLQPDLTLLFTLDPATAAARLAGARVPDKFERQPLDFFRAVADGYSARCAQDPQRFAPIDADRPREAVWSSVDEAVRRRGLLGPDPARSGSP